MSVIIALCGEKGVGKDTAAERLIEEFGFRRVSFADSLRFICSEAFDVDYELFSNARQKEMKFDTAFILDKSYSSSLIDSIEKEAAYYNISLNYDKQALKEFILNKKFTTPREILQFVGTEVVRDRINPDFWILVAEAIIKNSVQKRIVITDCRFKNERLMLKNSLGAHLLRLKRASSNKSTHVSENSLGSDKEYDKVILNNQSIDQVQKKIEEYYIYNVKKYPKPLLKKLKDLISAS